MRSILVLLLSTVASFSDGSLWEIYAQKFDIAVVAGQLNDEEDKEPLETYQIAASFLYGDGSRPPGQILVVPKSLTVSDVLLGAEWLVGSAASNFKVEVAVAMYLVDGNKVENVQDGEGMFIIADRGVHAFPRIEVLSRFDRKDMSYMLELRGRWIRAQMAQLRAAQEKMNLREKGDGQRELAPAAEEQE